MATSLPETIQPASLHLNVLRTLTLARGHPLQPRVGHTQLNKYFLKRLSFYF